MGPNGAGKTTAMNIITGYISATEGSVIIDGRDILDEPEKVKKNIGYLPDAPPLYQDFTVREYLSFVMDLKKVKKSERNLAAVCQTTKLADVTDRLIKNLSKGYRQRVGLAQALIGNPAAIILDEPTNGLDPRQIIEMRDVIKRLGKNRTIILSSHILSEVAVICDRVIIINEGKIVAADTASGLSAAFNKEGKTQARIRGAFGAVSNVLKSSGKFKSVIFKGTYEKNCVDLDVTPNENIDARLAIFKICAANNLDLLLLKSYDYTLEEIFIELTKQTFIKDDETENSSENIRENIREEISEEDKTETQTEIQTEIKEGENNAGDL